MKNTFAVDFSLAEAAKGLNFEELVKEQESKIVEFDVDGFPTKIKYPIGGNVFLIEYDDRDKFSTAGCTWMAMHLLDHGCRVFSSKNRYFVSTPLARAELKRLINELMSRMRFDWEFWDMLKCYEEQAKMQRKWHDV